MYTFGEEEGEATISSATVEERGQKGERGWRSSVRLRNTICLAPCDRPRP